MTQFFNNDLTIRDFYCNGFFGRRYDLTGSNVLVIGDRYIVVRTTDNETLLAEFNSTEQMNHYLNEWTR